MKDELISIVVPVYNVEEYITECLDSICNQRYEKIEIILVDDGSGDESGKICDRYEQFDSRIRVIHKENEGLSEARNTGMRLASGQYLMFVDSDDVIAENLTDQLYQLCKDTQAQIAMCDFMDYNKNCQNDSDASEWILMDRNEAVYELCLDRKIKNFAWGKLYHRRLFDGIVFPAGQMFEDINTIYKVFLQSSRVVYTDMKGYYYRRRRGAITQTKSIFHALQRTYAHQQRYVDLKKRQNGLEPILLNQLLYSYIMLAKSFQKADKTERIDQKEAIIKSIDFLREYQAEITQKSRFDYIENLEFQRLLQKGELAFCGNIFLDYLHKVKKRIGI